MKCPNINCNYEHGWNGDKEIKGNSGEFYTLTNDIDAVRADSDSYTRRENKTVYFCPKCGISFIEVRWC